jgi:hypothetical protein
MHNGGVRRTLNGFPASGTSNGQEAAYSLCALRGDMMMITNPLGPMEAGSPTAEAPGWIMRTVGRRLGHHQNPFLERRCQRPGYWWSGRHPNPFGKPARMARSGLGGQIDVKTR